MKSWKSIFFDFVIFRVKNWHFKPSKKIRVRKKRAISDLDSDESDSVNKLARTGREGGDIKLECKSSRSSSNGNSGSDKKIKWFNPDGKDITWVQNLYTNSIFGIIIVWNRKTTKRGFKFPGRRWASKASRSRTAARGRATTKTQIMSVSGPFC